MKNRVKALVIAGVLGLTGVVGLRAFAGNSGKASVDPAPESVYENGWERVEKEKSYVYCVASISKVYTTAAVMQLVDEGKVRLDAPVTEYLPDFRMADDRYQKITVRMLMNHTSGIMGTTQLGAFLYGDASSVHHDELLNILAGQRLKAEPGDVLLGLHGTLHDGADKLGKSGSKPTCSTTRLTEGSGLEETASERTPAQPRTSSMPARPRQPLCSKTPCT